MELEQLRIFVAVAESKSFTRAAEHMYVSHSSTSRAVSALEEELGVKLMNRDNKVFGLTKAGETLLAKAKELLRMADELEKSVRNAQ